MESTALKFTALAGGGIASIGVEITENFALETVALALAARSTIDSSAKDQRVKYKPVRNS